MGLRSRRSSTATLRTINTVNGNGGGGGPQSPRESIAEVDEEEGLEGNSNVASGSGSGSGSREQGGLGIINIEPKNQEERRMRLNPKASSSWLRWNSPTPSFPKGKDKGKGKERAEGGITPVRRGSTVEDPKIDGRADAGVQRTITDEPLDERIQEQPLVSSPPSLTADEQPPVASVPPPSVKPKGWFSKNPPPLPLTQDKGTTAPTPAIQTVPDDKSTETPDSAGPAKPDEAKPSSEQPVHQELDGVSKGPIEEDQAKSSDGVLAGPGEADESKPIPSDATPAAGGWKEYLTWGRKGASRGKIPSPMPEFSVAPDGTVEMVGEVTQDIDAQAEQTTEPSPTGPPATSTEVSDPVQASLEPSSPGETEVTPSQTTGAASKTWGSFLYGIVIPQIKEQEEGLPPRNEVGVPVTSDPTTEQAAVHTEDLPDVGESVAAEAPIDPVEPVTTAEPSKQTLQPVPASRKNSQVSTTAGWLSYLAFRASQKKVEAAPSTVTADTAEEVMDFSNDPNFPTAPADSQAPIAKTGTTTETIPSKPATKGAMKPPATLPDKKKRLSTSSLRSATSVTPIPPSPQSQARLGTGTPSIAPSLKGSSALPAPPQQSAVQPNLVIPAFATTFDRPPRSFLPPKPESPMTPPAQTGYAWRALGAVGNYVYPGTPEAKPAQKAVESVEETRGRKEGRHIGHDLPRRIGLAGEEPDDGWKNVKRVVVVGVHGW